MRSIWTGTRYAAYMVTVMLLLMAPRVAAAAPITLMWDATAEPAVTGYAVSIGTQPGIYTSTVDVGNVTAYVYPDAVAGTRYYFAIRAYSAGPVYSPFSAEVSGFSNAPPALTNPGSRSSVRNVVTSLQLVGSDPYDEAVSYSATGLPAGLTLASSTGLIAGTPTTAGTYNVTATVSDGVLTASQSFTWTITAPDTTAPAVTISSPTSSGTYATTTSSVTLSGTASDAVGVTQVSWTNDRGGSGTATGTTSWNSGAIALQAGANVLTISARDAANNTSTDVLTVTYTDNTAPVVSVTAPTSSSTYSTSASTVTLSGTASDNVAVTLVSWASDRGGSGAATGTTTWNSGAIALQAGANVITVTARDAAGNTKTDVVTVTQTVPDTTAPAVSITGPATATYSTTTGTLALSGSASDAIGVTQVSWANDRGGSGTATGTTAWSASVALQTGVNVVTVTARDAANNTTSDVVTVTYTDATAPTLSITAPTSSASYSTTLSSVTLSGTAADNIAVTQVVWVNDAGGSGTATGTTSWNSGTIALQFGANVITMTARDAANNIVTDVLTVTRTDATAPTLAITSPTSSSTYTATAGTVTVGGTASDNRAVTQVSWVNSTGGSGTATGTTNWSTGAITLQDGSNVITVTARDAANNTKTDALTITYSQPVPVAPTLVSPSGTLGTATPTFTWNAVSGAASYLLYVNDAVTTAKIRLDVLPASAGCAAGTGICTVSPGVALTLGAGQWWVVASNSAGTGPWSAGMAFTVPGAADTTAPMVTIGAPASGTTTSASTVAVSGTASDAVGVTQVTWTNDRGGSGTATGTTSWSIAAVTLQTGANAITVTARDAAGNTRTASVTVTVSSVPVAPTLVSPSGMLANATPTFRWNAVSGAASYLLYVNDAVTTAKIRLDVLPASAGCAAGTGICTVSPGVALTLGAGQWWVVASNSAGTGPWSAGMAFTVPGAADTTAPMVTIGAPASGTTTSASTVAVSGTASDAVGVTQVTWTNDRGGSGAATGTTNWSIAAVTLQMGANVITVTARDAAGNTRTASLTVTVTTSSVPVAPMLISPSGTLANATPTFTWNAVSGAASYLLYVNDAVTTAKIRLDVLPASAGCAAGTGICTVSPGVALTLGAGQWWVVASNSAGTGPWSAGMAFTVPGAADTTAPMVTIGAPASGTTTSASTVAVSGTASDAVGVTQVTWTNDRGGSGTATGTNSWTITAVTLQTGANAITVTARDAAGNTRTASVTVAYTASSVPVAPTLVSPSGTLANATPTFTWNAVSGAASYLLYVNDAVTTAKIRLDVLPASAGCAAGAGICTVSPGVALTPGAGQWWVVASNSAGTGPWSAAMAFTVPGSLSVPVAPTLVSPNGTLAKATPTFTWNAVSGAASYLLYVNDAVTTAKIRLDVLPASAGCAAGTGICTVSPGVALTSGAGQWWVVASNSVGTGPWSSGMPFTVP